jgi:predicted RNA-binding protein YlxR (DUF448 family)
MEQERTCAVCGKSGPKRLMVRFVASPGGTPRPDVAGKAPGRGVYACPSQECINGLFKPGTRKKAGPAGTEPKGGDTAVLVAEAITARIRSLLSIARRSGNLAIGSEESLAAVKSGAAFAAVAGDAGTSASDLSGSRCLRLSGMDRKALGALLGGGLCAALAVRDAGLARAVSAEFSRLDGLRRGVCGAEG